MGGKGDQRNPHFLARFGNTREALSKAVLKSLVNGLVASCQGVPLQTVRYGEESRFWQVGFQMVVNMKKSDVSVAL